VSVLFNLNFVQLTNSSTTIVCEATTSSNHHPEAILWFDQASPLWKNSRSVCRGTSSLDILYVICLVRNRLSIKVEDLRNFKHYQEIEAIRTSSWWIPATPWLISVPQGYSDLYNPLVMQKVLWLRDLAASNPFKTKHFLWLDSGMSWLLWVSVSPLLMSDLTKVAFVLLVSEDLDWKG